MFPLKTLPNAKTTPHLTRVLALACVLIFAVQWWFQVARGVDLAIELGVHPRCLWSTGTCAGDSPQESWLSVFYALFLHGDLLHLGFNVWFLLVFGGAIEDQIGRIRFLLCYFCGGLAATLAHSATNPFSMTTAIGASGAIAAILGAYLVRLPKSWVLTYVPPVFLFPIPAPLFLLVWIGMQVLGALEGFSVASTSNAGSNIAWFAHLGGFAFGAFYGWKIRARKGAKRKGGSNSIAAMR